MTSKPMGRADMERLGSLIWGGHGWKTELARALEVDRKTISRWIASDSAPEWAASRIRAMAHIAPPPGTTADEDRDDACADAIEGDLSRLVELATDAGWNRGEVQVAILSLIATDIMAHVGPSAAIETLDQCRAIILERAIANPA